MSVKDFRSLDFPNASCTIPRKASCISSIAVANDDGNPMTTSRSKSVFPVRDGPMVLVNGVVDGVGVGTGDISPEAAAAVVVVLDTSVGVIDRPN